MKVTILGSGSAAGVPSVSGGWGKCDPANPKNRRSRASILVEEGPVTLLIDTSPDLREQMLASNLRRVDAVLFTHAHADHSHGIDELRELTRINKAPVPAYATAETMTILETRFGYVFKGIPPGAPYFRPWLTPHVIAARDRFSVAGIGVECFPQDHGYSETVGFRFGDFAYSTDVVRMPPDSMAALKGVKVWLLGVLSDVAYPTHVHVEEALRWVAEVKPERAVFTHMSNALDFDELAKHLPANVTLAWDGRVIEV